MRKTQCWGWNNYAVNFEWPTAQDLLQMLKNKLNIKVADLKYKNWNSNNDWFGGFQIILSNGTASPVFKAAGQDEKNMQSFAIADYSVVKRIKGSELNSTGWPLHKLSFGKRDGYMFYR